MVVPCAVCQIKSGAPIQFIRTKENAVQVVKYDVQLRCGSCKRRLLLDRTNFCGHDLHENVKTGFSIGITVNQYR